MLSGFQMPQWLTLLLAIAVGLMLTLVVFSGKMPTKVRRGIEMTLAVAYPVLVGGFFGLLSWTAWREGEQVRTIGFAVGGVVMVALAIRGYLKARKRS